MAVLGRGLHRSSRSPLLNDEGCWQLAFDSDTKQLYSITGPTWMCVGPE